MAEVERERAERSRHWQRRRERAWFEAERAARQDQACEPENRLVGRERERRWEEAWKAQRPVEDDYERWQRSAPGRLSPDDEAAIRTLAASRLAVGAPGRRRPPRDLGRRLRAAAAACTPPAAANLGEQGSARRIEEAEAMPGAVECRWPGSPRAGPPHRALGGHYGWNIEVTFEESRAHLGVESQRQWSDLAIQRETPCLLGLYSLVVTFGRALHEELPIAVRTASWYPKAEATFSDVLAAARRHYWGALDIRISRSDPGRVEIPRTHLDRLVNAACYSH